MELSIPQHLIPSLVGAPGSSLGSTALTCAAAGLIGLVMWARVRIRTRRPTRPGFWTPLLAGAVSAAGLALFIPRPSLADERPPVSPARRGSLRLPPWVAVSGYHPPRPLTRPEAHPMRPTSPRRAEMGSADEKQTGARRVHAGAGREWVIPRVIEIGPDGVGLHDPSAPAAQEQPGVVAAKPIPIQAAIGNLKLGPRPVTSRNSAPARDRHDEVAAAMRRHPAGKSLPCRYVVVDGDTLWDIASRVLGSPDRVRVARYWSRIHRANRDVIGRDPNLIAPGQVLRLPAECD